jgi:hypothetical protein
MMKVLGQYIKFDFDSCRQIIGQIFFPYLCQFFNMPDSNIDYVKNWTTKMTFLNVWDRRTIFIHTSIANTTPYNYLGHDNEFYTTPSKLYKRTSKSKTFRVWVSFNGETPVIVYHQPFVLQFQLIASC